MNTERLSLVLRAIRAEYAATKLPEMLQQLSQHLKNMVQQPQHANHQNAVSNMRGAIRTALRDAPSNSWSPAWHQMLEDMGADQLVGNALASRIDAAFEQNEITPASAAKDLDALLGEVKQLHEAVQRVLTGFDDLQIASEDLRLGECELGIVVPRASVGNELGAFGAELSQIAKLYGLFSEVATGVREQPVIREVSSSDLTVFLEAAAPVAALIAAAAERVIAAYKKLLEIRKLRAELSAQGVPDGAMTGVEEHANSVMETEIQSITAELFDPNCAVDDAGRRNELRTEFRYGLNQVAARIDEGYNFEVRMGLDDTGASEAMAEAYTRFHDVISDAARTLEFMRLEGQPILALPQSSSEDDSPASTTVTDSPASATTSKEDGR